MTDGDDDEIAGAEGEDTEGKDPGTGDEGAEVSAEQPDAEEDDGESEVVDGEGDKPSRGQSRIQRLANEAKAERERASRLEQELSEARRSQWQRQQAASEEERQARRALMTAEERVQDDMLAMRRQFDAERQQDRMSTAAMMDKAAYDAKAATNRTYAKYRDVIEDQFQKMLREGRPVEREILLQNHLGKLALDGAGNSGGAKRKAQARVESQRVPAGSGKGDAPSNRGKAGDTAENRLKDVYI